MQHEQAEAGPLRVLSEAIFARRMVSVSYNGATLTLAPHQLFLRHGVPFLGAFNPDKNWRGPEDYRLGNFNLTGLRELTVLDQAFEPIAAFDGSPPSERDQVLVSVETAAAEA
jgi:hypothetical protein